MGLTLDYFMARLLEKLNKYSYLLSMVLLCSTLFVFMPGTTDKFGIAKVEVLIIFLILSALTTLFLSLANSSQKLVITKATLVSLGVFALVILTTVFALPNSSNAINSFWGDSSSIANAFWPYVLSLSGVILIVLSISADRFMAKISVSFLMVAVSMKSLLFTVLYLFTAGQTLTLVANLDYKAHTALALVAIMTSVGLASKKSFTLSFSAILVAIINLSFLILATPQLSVVALALGLITSLVLMSRADDRNDKSKLIIIVILILAILAKIWLASAAIISTPLPKTVDPLAAVVSSINAVSDSNNSLLWGKGLSSFAGEFNRTRPISVNETPDWQEVFVVPTSELSRVIVEQGVVITLLVLSFICYLSILVIKTDGATTLEASDAVRTDVIGAALSTAAKLGLAGFIIAFLFAAWDISTVLWFAVFIALVTSSQRGHLYVPGWFGVFGSIAPLLVIAVVVLVRVVPMDPLTQMYTYMRAEQEFQQGLDDIQSNNARSAYEHITEARKYVPDRAKYRERFALLSLAIGESVLTATNGAESNVEQLFSQAISEIKTATEQLAPNSIPYWISRINIYSSLENKYANSITQAINSYDRLIALAPNQPLFRLQQGIKLHDNQEDVRAIQRFTEAISLKPDYYQAYLARAQSYKAQGKLEEAKQDLVLISQKVAISDPVYQQAAEELKKLFGE